MTTDDYREFLRRSLSDARISRGERQALASALLAEPPTPEQRAELSRLAFSLAREAVQGAPQAAATFDWLEEVLKVLTVQSASTSTGCAGDACFSPGEACRDRIAGLFRTAVRSADVCVFTITDNAIAEAILSAHRRGISVRIITDDLKSLDLGSDVARFESEGIEVRLDRTKHHMHHKFAIFDRSRLVTGSYNWTLGAALDNEEHIVILSERLLLDRFQREFDRLWESYR